MTRFPRLAIVGDIRIARTAGGALLLSRLLDGYPKEKLLLVGNQTRGINPTDYHEIQWQDMNFSVSHFVKRWAHPLWPLMLPSLLEPAVNQVINWLVNFRAEAVLTVPWGFGWLAGVEAARRLEIPLHLIIHDDWPCTITSNGWGIQGKIRRFFAWSVFAKACKEADSVLCVSKPMQEEYSRKLGKNCGLLMPSRGKDSPEPRVRVKAKNRKGPVIAYCGLINQAGTLKLLRLLSEILLKLNGFLDLYMPYTDAELVRMKIAATNVRRCGFLPPAEMANRLGESADALFLPASFEKREQRDVALLFPSKIADYTAIGLPIVFWGPRESSGVKWALANLLSASVVDSLNTTKVMELIQRIHDNICFADKLAYEAMIAGNLDFDQNMAITKFYNYIQTK